MRLATVFDSDSNEPRPVFELPGGHRVELRELFRPVPSDAPQVVSEDELTDVPLYFTDIAKTVEFLDDVIDAVRQWSRHRADRITDSTPTHEPSRVDAMPFMPPVPVVRNFREFDAFEQHARTWRARFDLKMPPDWHASPTFTFGGAGSLIGHEVPVRPPRDCEELDYGLQIAAIVGRGGRDIRAQHAWNHIAGFTIVNAFIARDIERREMAMHLGRGKSRDFATAVGPYLVSRNALADRIDSDDRLHLAMRAMVNGTELSRSDAAAMAFTWPQLIETASRDAELYPGDLIAGGIVGTGSVLDLGGSSAAPWLKPGDVVELEVERLGILRTPIADGHPKGAPAYANAMAGRATLAI